jgi:hypothetical protein
MPPGRRFSVWRGGEELSDLQLSYHIPYKVEEELSVPALIYLFSNNFEFLTLLLYWDTI